MSDDVRNDAYATSGVDRAAGAAAVDRIADAVRGTYREEVVSDIGGFGGLFDISAAKKMERPILDTSTDGVGTKLALAIEAGYHRSVGIDLVAMCANDVLVSGAEPLFLTDYIAAGKTVPEKMEEIVEGIAQGCRQAGCALIAGEMAEHNTMDSDEYDLSATCTGIVDGPKVIDGSQIRIGDVVIGVASRGLHSNGFSLARKVRGAHKIALDSAFPIQDTELSERIVRIGEDPSVHITMVEVLLQPTAIYVYPVLALLRSGADVRGLVHITGDGLDNIMRVLPKHMGVTIDNPLPVHPEFDVIRELAERHPDPEIASITTNTMYATFNMGMGFVIIAAEDEVHQILNKLDDCMPECHSQVVGFVDGSGEITHEALDEPFQS